MRCPRGERAATARRIRSCRRTCSDRAANAQQARSKRAASAQQARSKCAASGPHPALVEACMYLYVCQAHIHPDMSVTYIQICTALRNAYVHVSACMSAEYSRHTGTYALDTAPMSRRYIQIQCNTCRYKSVHITYALCICDMHSVVSCAYASAYVYVFLAHTSHIYQSISVMYVLKIHTHMHLQVH